MHKQANRSFKSGSMRRANEKAFDQFISNANENGGARPESASAASTQPPLLVNGVPATSVGGGNYIDNRTGNFLQGAAGGVVDTKTGKFMPTY
ncbi:hypothetical protein [Allochromatium palmeri]|uniref:Uncharacterized protein n=1 Tax=Allochromatium palmeri TaxID=231048 RepID=A0A6N8EB58_9GAMM|nr:hypothetical protein [Allochromatium palmeri]MTW21385.1 hypothetical protein [Allochromatium palmeri]